MKVVIIGVFLLFSLLLFSSFSQAKVQYGTRNGVKLCSLNYDCGIADGVCPALYDNPSKNPLETGSPFVCSADDVDCCSTDYWNTNKKKADGSSYPQMMWMSEAKGDAVDAKHLCCGNAPNEFYKTGQFDNLPACCDSQKDAVHNGECYRDVWEDYKKDQLGICNPPGSKKTNCPEIPEKSGKRYVNVGGKFIPVKDVKIPPEIVCTIPDAQIPKGQPIPQCATCELLFGKDYILNEAGECVSQKEFKDVTVMVYKTTAGKSVPLPGASVEVSSLIVTDPELQTIETSILDTKVTDDKGKAKLKTKAMLEVTIKVTKVGFEGESRTKKTDKLGTETFTLKKSTECMKDCTRNDGYCHAECYGINDCTWNTDVYGTQSNYICDVSKIKFGKGWEANSPKYGKVYCCTGNTPDKLTPIVPPKKLTESDAIKTPEQGVPQVQTYSRLAIGPNGKPVIIYISVWEPSNNVLK